MKFEEIESTILKVISDHRAMALGIIVPGSKVDEQNQLTSVPWTIPVYYVFEHWHFFFFSSPGSIHGQCLSEGNLACSAAIYNEPEDYDRIQGVQMIGNVHRIEGIVNKARVLANFENRFSFMRNLLQDKQLAQSVGRNKLYCFTPQAVYLTNNQMGFGKRMLYKPPVG